ncbi:MAG: hydrogenase nickel incorporation protein HypB [Lachnospiraceae bacterium]|nr:hydrogenase nickel incorporation protein HypB [Lachnospiraceae bacterium]
MMEIKTVDLKASIFEDNDLDAGRLRKSLKEKGCFLLNVMSSPGSGKTTALIRLINQLKDEYKIAVMEADIDSDKDARRVAGETGVRSVQLHTGGMCHLDADMTRQGVASLGEESYDLIILENVGNLVCPAEFDTGSVKNLTILSVPEGDDKPLKYPLMYQVSNALMINKIDVLPYFDFDIEKAKEYAKRRNPELEIFPVCAKSGEGMEPVCEWLRREIEAWKNN